MNELIKLQPQPINGNAVETVNARELHSFMESKQDFSTWIKNRIEKYDFVENQDYVSLHKKMERESGSIILLCSDRHTNFLYGGRRCLPMHPISTTPTLT